MTRIQTVLFSTIAAIVLFASLTASAQDAGTPAPAPKPPTLNCTHIGSLTICTMNVL